MAILQFRIAMPTSDKRNNHSTCGFFHRYEKPPSRISCSSLSKSSSYQDDHSNSDFPSHNQSVAAIVFGDGSESRLHPFTKRRSEGAVPIAANYRLIDVVVSNCINSNITKIYALTQFNSTSLNSHLSKAYSGVNLGKDGLVEVIAAYQSPEDKDWFKGNADAVRRCLWVLDEHPVTDFLILPGHHLYKMDYQKLIQRHRSSGADITVAATWDRGNHNPGFGILTVNSENEVAELKEMKEFEAPVWKNKQGCQNIRSMGIYAIKRDSLTTLLREHLPKANEFVSEVIPGAISMGMKVHSYMFNGYWEDMRNVEAFYHANIESTKKTTTGFNFYDRDSPVYTTPRCLPSSLITDAVIIRSIIGDGCILNRCKIKDSVIGMRTWIGDEAMIEDSVIMGADIYQKDDLQWSGMDVNVPIGIGEQSYIRKAIVDKNARIGKNVKIINKDNVLEGSSESCGYAISGGIVIILRSATIPDGSII